MDEFDIGILIDEAILENNVNNMPKEVKDKYNLKDWYLYYDYTEADIAEVYDYINSTIEEINEEIEFEPNPSNTFFCNNLCNHADLCPAIQKLNNSMVTFDTEDDMF